MAYCFLCFSSILWRSSGMLQPISLSVLLWSTLYSNGCNPGTGVRHVFHYDVRKAPWYPLYVPQTIECWTDHLYSFDELFVSYRARIYFNTICCCDFPSELRSKCNEKASYYLRLSYLCVQRIVQRVAGDGSFWRRATKDWQYISLHMLDIFYRNYLHPSFYRF